MATEYTKDGHAVTTIDRFDGGITTRGRKTKDSYSRSLKHFDCLSSPDKLIPHRNFTDDTFNSNLGASVVSNGVRIVKFLQYGTSQSGTVMFGLGTGTSGAGATTDNTPRLYYRDSLPDAQWSGDSGTTGVVNENLFVEYRGIAYAARANEIIQWTLDVAAPLGGSAVASSLSLTFTSIFQGLVHRKDDILYIPYLTSSGAFIARNNAGTWTNVVLTLPVFVGNMDIAEYGNDLAIACQPKFLGGNSYVYIWDRDSSLTTLESKIDWGTENIQVVGAIDGVLWGISTNANSSTNFSGTGQVLFKYWDGKSDTATTYAILNADDRTISVTQKQVKNGRLYFMMSGEFNGSWQEGVFSWGKNEEGRYVLTLEYGINNDTQVTSVILKGFNVLGDYVTVAYSDNGTYRLKITDDQNYTDTCIWESVIFGGNGSKRDLVGTTVMYEPQPTAGQVVLKYATDANIGTNTWTTISTDTTDNGISDSAINIESSGAHLPTDYKQIAFRIEVTGGTNITGLSFKEKITGKLPY